MSVPHAGNHLVVIPPHVIPSPLPAPLILPSGRFQSIDDAICMWTNDLDPASYPRIRFPDEEAAHHNAHPRWERYQTATCWERRGTTLLLHGWYWLNQADGTWDPAFQPAVTSGTIWHDAENNIDRFVMSPLGNPPWSFLGWVRDEGSSVGWLMRWQVRIEAPGAPVGKRGGDVGWSGDSRLADPGNQPPACPSVDSASPSRPWRLR
jgi:hypothetical protein